MHSSAPLGPCYSNGGNSARALFQSIMLTGFPFVSCAEECTDGEQLQ